MNAELWTRVREVLHELMDADLAGRTAILDRVGGSDPELRREAESLLAEEARAAKLDLTARGAAGFDHAGSLLGDLDSVAAGEPRRLGPFRLLRQLGRGGMGVVWLAERDDGEFSKRVAIKILPPFFASPEMERRFRRERQILAGLEHPNIARLLDGGIGPEGQLFLVMEYIDGVPLDAWVRERGLDIEARLKVFLDVLAAVSYAHRNFVVHRDIKPGNILINSDGQVKLLDFGLARVMEEAGPENTQTQFPMLTPAYASPEHIRGERVSAASDVFSAGVLLYELLTGVNPFAPARKTPTEVQAAVCQVDPPPPSRAAANQRDRDFVARSYRIPDDLDNIVLKAIEKEPVRRYSTVDALAQDVRWHLEGRPVAARAATLWYRVRKFAGRNRVLLGVAAVAVLAVALSLVAAVRQSRLAQRRFEDARKVANSFLFEFDDAIKNLPGSTPARALVVKRALEYLDGLAAQSGGDRVLETEIASAYQRIGAVQGDPAFPNLGDSQGALASSHKALAILEALSRRDAGNEELRLAVAAIHQQISSVLAFTGDMAGAVEQSGEALEIRENLSRRMANDAHLRTELVVQTYNHANLLKLTGHLDQSAAEYRRAVELSEGLVAENPSSKESKFHLATSVDGLGYVLQEKGDTAGGLENRRKGLEIRQGLAASDPDDAHFRRELAFSYHNVGLSLVEAGDLSAALDHFHRELSLFESLSAADPQDVQARRNRSLALKQIGDVLMRQGDADRALDQYLSALDTDRSLSSADPKNSQALLDLSFSEGKVGSALGKLGHATEGLDLMRAGIARQESLLAQDPQHILMYSHLANSYTRLANYLLETGGTDSAIEYYQKAVAARMNLSEKSVTSETNRSALAECFSNLGKANESRDAAEALKQYRKAIELLEQLTAKDASNTQYRIALAEVLTRAGRAYARMASRSGEEASLRRQYLTKARSSDQRSEDLWLELERKGKLPTSDRKLIRDAASELARSKNSLERLQFVH